MEIHRFLKYYEYKDVISMSIYCQKTSINHVYINSVCVQQCQCHALNSIKYRLNFLIFMLCTGVVQTSKFIEQNEIFVIINQLGTTMVSSKGSNTT